MSDFYTLKTAGLMLYAGEWAKTGRTVDLINSNPLIINLFTKYLRECCKISENRLKFYLYCFDNQDVSAIIAYWCDLLTVSPEQFTRPYVRAVTGPVSRMSKYGVIHVRYSDKYLLKSILADIDKILTRFCG